MAGFLESAFGAVCGLIEAGPVKIDNKLVEGLLGAAAVGVAGYTAYKVLNDKGAAENVATVMGGGTPPYSGLPSGYDPKRSEELAAQIAANHERIMRDLPDL
jgi:hypothetical protein